jgi:hypothetical protein
MRETRHFCLEKVFKVVVTICGWKNSKIIKFKKHVAKFAIFIDKFELCTSYQNISTTEMQDFWAF